MKIKYASKRLIERIELIVREEINTPHKYLGYANFVEQFIYRISDRLNDIVEDEIEFGRKE